ncbi:MAG: molybdopterin-dependent oxidoreductase, partial [Dehalococcoidia bacterium]
MSQSEKIVKAFCAGCPYRCGIDVTVRDGRATRVRPMPEHFAQLVCVKGAAWKEMLYHRDRLTHPLKRANGRWEKISWDRALEEIGEKLQEIKERSGPESLAVYPGTSYGLVDTEALIRRFCDVYGTPNTTDTLVLCLGATFITGRITFGSVLMPSFGKSRCIMLFGFNPPDSYPVADRAIRRAREAGAKLIVVDPRTTPLAKIADIHAALRPGTDGALALAMANVIIREGLHDRDFVQKWTVGFDQFAERVKEYPPERAAEITWVPADTIIQMARMYATHHPAALSPGVGAEQNSNALSNIRAIMSLVAITGNFEVSGGNRLQPFLEFPRLSPEERAVTAPIFGHDQYPILTEYLDRPHWSFFTDGIDPGTPYPIKAIMTLGSNPALTMPDTRRVQESLKKLELLVAVDSFMRETAQLAHYVLPMASYLERTELVGQLGVPQVAYHHRAVEPVGESRPVSWIIIELAKKMGYGKYFDWSGTDELFSYLLGPSGLTLEEVKASPGGVFYAPKAGRRYETEGLATPSGKIELSSSILEKAGYDPLPAYNEQEESPAAQPELAREYPLILSTGARLLAFTHANHRNLPSLSRREPHPRVEIHPDTAGGLGIEDGDDVLVETLRGGIQVKAWVTR